MAHARMRNIGRSVVAAATAIGLAGCAHQSRERPKRDWSDHATKVSEIRLAAARDPIRAATVRERVWHRRPAGVAADLRVDRMCDADLRALPLPHGRGSDQTRPLEFRLVADAPEPGPADADAGESTTQPAEVERGPLPGLWETIKRDAKEAPGVLWGDTKKVYGDPLNLIFLVGAGGASLALRPEVDDDIEDYYDSHHTFTEDWRDGFGALGNPATHFALAGVWYLAGQQLQDIKTYEVGKRAVSALAITGVSTMLLKVAAYTDSPNGENLAWPSGHVSSTMALATVLNDAYGPVVGVPMFGLTALVGIERLDDREHHLSDVVFGAALGWVVAETIMKEHRPEIFGGQIVPYVDPLGRNAGLAWVKTLGE